MCVAAFNLLPARGLDGSIAWSIVPKYLRRRRARPKARSALAIGVKGVQPLASFALNIQSRRDDITSHPRNPTWGFLGSPGYRL